MFPFSELLSHAELTKRRPTMTAEDGVPEGRQSPRQTRYGNLTLFPRIERPEPLVEGVRGIVEEFEDPRVIASISNVSATGVGLILSEELPSGLEFDVDWKQGESPLPLRFEVVHSRPLSAGMYRTGARLIEGVLPQEPMPMEFVRIESPVQVQETYVIADEPVQAEPSPLNIFAGVLKYEPEAAEKKAYDKTPVPTGTFKASSAFGFDKTEQLEGVTTCGWDRSISFRREGDRLWVYIHSPGKKNGWGIYVDADNFQAAFDRVQEAAKSPFIASMAA